MSAWVRACVHDGHDEIQKQCDRAATSTRFAELCDRPRATWKRARTHTRAQWHTVIETDACVRPPKRRRQRRRRQSPLCPDAAARRAGGKRTRWISASFAKRDIAHESAATYARGAWLVGIFRRRSATFASARHSSYGIPSKSLGARMETASLTRPCRALLARYRDRNEKN